MVNLPRYTFPVISPSIFILCFLWFWFNHSITYHYKPRFWCFHHLIKRNTFNITLVSRCLNLIWHYTEPKLPPISYMVMAGGLVICGPYLVSFPGPAHLSVAFRTVKRERAWYLFSREWCQDRKGGRKGLIVRGHTGPRTAKRTKVQGSLPHVSG